MKIVIAYICVTHGTRTREYAARFVGTMLAHPPGAEYDLAVVCNGGPLPHDLSALFMPLKGTVHYLPRINDAGWDIAGYQDVARLIPSELQVCFGESCYFHRAGWLDRLLGAVDKHGPGMYGFMASNLVRAHLNTTAFAVDPKHLRAYPRVTAAPQRYEFEHGQKALWRLVDAVGGAVRCVTWEHVHGPKLWRSGKNILWRGDQSDLLVWCSHVDRYRAADATTRQKWAEGADSPYK